MQSEELMQDKDPFKKIYLAKVIFDCFVFLPRLPISFKAF